MIATMGKPVLGIVEPIFGSLLHHDGLRRLNVRDHAGSHKTMLLTAVADNLKKAAGAANTRACRRNKRQRATQKDPLLNRVLQQPRP